MNNKKLLRRVGLTIFMSACSLLSYAQSAYQQYQTGIKSPEATSLGIFGQIPTTLFNGMVNVQIPIEEIKCGEITIPIALNYNSSGNRPSQHPGWVGLGWTLETGGIVTRKVNQRRDEEVIFNFPDRAYINTLSDLSPSDWYSSTPGPNDSYDYYPDEFNFTVGRLSGSFYLSHDGTWKVRSKDNVKFRIEHEMAYNYNITESGYISALPRCYSKFIITSDDGTKYIFGGEVNATEFSFPAAPSGNTWGDPLPYSEYLMKHPSAYEVEANAWYLKSIVSPTGRTITFNYSSEYYLLLNQVLYTNFFRTQEKKGHLSPDPIIQQEEGRGNLVSRHYLHQIVTDDSLTYDFSRSLSGELTQPFVANSDYYDFESYGWWAPNFQYCKLDGITKKFGNKILKKYGFEYIENNSERLKLNKVTFKTENDIELYNYRLNYNNELLPEYNSGREDHWGFYNNKPYYYTPNNPSPFEGQQFFQSREPDSTYADAEILTKIIYPTGGSSQFIYEGHEYSSLVTQYPTIVCNPLGLNKPAGGLRIKKIINSDGSGTLSTKEYFYVKNYQNGSAISSGILSGSPLYYLEGTNDNFSWQWLTSQALSFLNTTNGNYITYSEVTEVENNNGYIITKFANHDNGYLDKEPFNKVSPHGSIPNLNSSKAFGSLELERGNPLFKYSYNSNNSLLKEEQFEYNQAASRFDDYVRAISMEFLPFGGLYDVAVRFPIYTYHPYLKKYTVKNYDNGGSVSNVTEFEYDPSSRLLKKKSTLNSKAEVNSYEYLYPSDYVNLSLDPSGTYDSMLAKNILKPVLQETFKIDNVQKRLEKTNYGRFATGHFLPESIMTWNPMTGVTETNYEYKDYDDKANLLNVKMNTKLPVSLVWGYNKMYLIAECQNAEQYEIYQQNFEDYLDFTEGGIILDDSRSHTGKRSAKITNLSSTEVISHGSRQTPINLTATKKFIYSGWVYSTGPSAQLFLFMKRANETGYYSYVDDVFTSEINKWIYLEKEVDVPADVNLVSLRLDNNGAGTVWFDDLRIQPAESSMRTYTYDPGIGMTSQTDAKGQTTYYEYDDMQRLSRVRDQDHNILKQYCYNYAGQVTDCFPVTYSNVEKSGSYTRNNCTSGYTPSAVTYTVAAGTYTAASQAAADALAQADVTANGQSYANANGTCTAPPTIYARIQFINPSGTAYYTDQDIYVQFFSDIDGTVPYTLTSDLTVSYRISTLIYVGSGGSDYTDEDHGAVVPANYTEYPLGRIRTFETWQDIDPDYGYVDFMKEVYVDLMDGSYQIIY